MIKKSRWELYPLTAHGLTHSEFAARWSSMRNMFADVDGTRGAAMYGHPDRMDFGGALQALKASFHVARDGWNGHGLYVTLQDGYPDGIAINGNTAESTGLPEGTVAAFAPYLMLYRPAYNEFGRTGQGGSHPASFVPWVPSMGDVLAEDWRIVPRPYETPAQSDDVAEFGEPTRRLP